MGGLPPPHFNLQYTQLIHWQEANSDSQIARIRALIRCQSLIETQQFFLPEALIHIMSSRLLNGPSCMLTPSNNWRPISPTFRNSFHLSFTIHKSKQLVSFSLDLSHTRWLRRPKHGEHIWFISTHLQLIQLERWSYWRDSPPPRGWFHQYWSYRNLIYLLRGIVFNNEKLYLY